MKNYSMIKKKPFLHAGALISCLAAMIAAGAVQYFDMDYYPITAT